MGWVWVGWGGFWGVRCDQKEGEGVIRKEGLSNAINAVNRYDLVDFVTEIPSCTEPRGQQGKASPIYKPSTSGRGAMW